MLNIPVYNIREREIKELHGCAVNSQIRMAMYSPIALSSAADGTIAAAICSGVKTIIFIGALES